MTHKSATLTLSICATFYAAISRLDFGRPDITLMGSRLLRALSVVVLCGSLAVPAHAAETDASGQAWQVDMRGKPPYKRTRTAAPEIDLASMEVDAAKNAETVVVWQRDTAGRPPFARQRVELPLIDSAAMETGNIDDGASQSSVLRTGRPPFKRHR